MDLSLAEAARLLGKSDRQVRYLVKQEQLPARKVAGQWRIRREDLPLSPGQERAEAVKRERAARIALEVLQPDGEEVSKRRFSVRELRTVRHGAPLYRSLRESLGPEHPAVTALGEALMLVACGCHTFHAREKVAFYGRAREELSRATMALLLEDGEACLAAVEQLEEQLLPTLGGLIRNAERRGATR